MDRLESHRIARSLARNLLVALAGLLGACAGQASKTQDQALPGNVGVPSTNMTGSGGAPASVPASAPSGNAGTTPPPAVPIGSGGSKAPAAGTGGATGAAGAGMPSAIPSLYDSATGMLAAPPQSKGVQISTDAYDLQPGEEAFRCFHTEVPIEGEIDVSYFESVMASGSHHFILYKSDGDTSPDGTMDPTGCQTAFPEWVYSSAKPYADLRMPEGVAMVLSSHQRVQFDMHYINTTEATLQAKVTLNVNLAQGKFEKAASLISFNTGVFLMPGAMQTVGGDCTPGAGAKFFFMLTHTHKRGVEASIDRVLANGQLGERLVHTTDWENPDQELWGPPFITFKPGEKFHYSCSYQNDGDAFVTVGTSAQTNEMCMAITYYFPATAGGNCQ